MNTPIRYVYAFAESNREMAALLGGKTRTSDVPLARGVPASPGRSRRRRGVRLRSRRAPCGRRTGHRPGSPRDHPCGRSECVDHPQCRPARQRLRGRSPAATRLDAEPSTPTITRPRTMAPSRRRVPPGDGRCAAEDGDISWSERRAWPRSETATPSVNRTSFPAGAADRAGLHDGPGSVRNLQRHTDEAAAGCGLAFEGRPGRRRRARRRNRFLAGRSARTDARSGWDLRPFARDRRPVDGGTSGRGGISALSEVRS